jgi:hypothetical protein
MGRDTEDKDKFSYMCETCNFMFFSLEKVREHKAITDHGRFVEKKRT